MERQTILIFLLGIAVGSLITSFILLRAEEASKRAYELGLRRVPEQQAISQSGNE